MIKTILSKHANAWIILRITKRLIYFFFFWGGAFILNDYFFHDIFADEGFLEMVINENASLFAKTT